MPIKGLKGGVGTKALGYGLGAATEPVDEHYNKTVVLLHGDGTEGASDSVNLGTTEAKAFLDNSPSNHTIGIAGNAKGNNLSPYYYADGYWSNSFNANADYLQVVDSTDFDFSGQFALECFLFYGRTNSAWGIFIANTSSAGTDHFQIAVDSSNNFDVRFGGSEYGGWAVSKNTWHHILVTRDSSNNLRTFLNGTLKSVDSDSSSIDLNSLLIGGRGGGNALFGELSNLRVVKGSIPTSYQTSSTTVDASIFTPSTSPLTTSSQGATSSDVKLLTCQSNRFIDNSSEGHDIVVGGTPKVSTNTPFTQSKTANVGSGFFDGTDDVLNIADDASLDFGTGDWTVECWFNQTKALSDYQTLWSKYASNVGYYIFTTSAGKILLGISNVSSTTSTATFSLNTWHHLAVTKYSGVLYVWLDGVQIATLTSASSLDNSTPFLIGNINGFSRFFGGYISDFRIVKGTALYTSGFTPPTTSLTAVTNTKLLTCQFEGTARNVGFTDMSPYRNELTPNGTAGVSVSNFTPFSTPEGEWSAYFNGSDSELNLTNTATIGTGNFTMEMWVHPENRSNACLIDSRSANGATDGIIFKLNGSKFQISGLNGTTNIPLNEWTHLAVVREGTGTNETKMYVNGALEKTITFNLDLTSTFFGVGVFNDGGNSGDYKGYISNLRVVNDTVYTGAFTVSSTPLTAISNTDVLICQSNRWEKDNSTNGFTVSVPQGSVAAVPFSPFPVTRQYSRNVVGGSLFIPASNNWLRIQHTGYEDMFYWTGDFTYEGWVYFITSNDTTVFYGEGGTYNAFNMDPGSASSFYENSTSGGGFGTESDIGQYQWTHVALVRSGSTIKMYKNGVASATTSTNSSALGYASQTFRFGSSPAQTFYLAFPRLSQKAVYTSNFTPPTSPYTSSNIDFTTVFASNFDNTAIDNRTMKTGVAPIGNTRISDEQIKFGIGSIKFDGTGDYLKIPDSPLFLMGDGDFTFECFLYFTSAIGNSNGTYRMLLSDATTNSNYLTIRGDGTDTNGVLQYNFSGSSANMSLGNGLTSNSWHHLAFSREGTTLRLYLNGTLTETDTSVSTNFNLNSDRGGVYVGAFNGPAHYLDGYMDEARLTKGVARYTGSSLIVPTKPFPDKQA